AAEATRDESYESRACRTTVNDPNVDGVPTIAPFDAFTIKPAGADPLHVTMPTAPCVVPPAVAYARPTRPFGAGASVALNDGALTTSGSVVVAMFDGQFASVACSVTKNDPIASGVPAMAPPVTDTPVGAPAIVQVTDPVPPVAVSGAE